MHLIRIIFLILLSSYSYAQLSGVHQSMNMVNGCKIHSFRGDLIKVFPGERCVFLENGDFVSQTKVETIYFSKTNELVWKTSNQFFHHQINLSNDKNRLLVLASGEKEVEGTLYRIDKFQVLELKTGKLLLEIDSDSVLKQMNLRPVSISFSFPPMDFKATKELSHFNSFYEIPEIPSNPKNPSWLRKGNFIVNTTGHGVFILDSELKKVLHHLTLKNAVYNRVHDVQIMRNGNLLAFVNYNSSPTGEKYSTIVELDLKNNKEVNVIGSDPKSFFFSEVCGGAQDIGNDEIFFSHNYSGVFLYSKRFKKIIYSNYSIFKDGNRIVPSQQIKLENLSSFLSNYKKSSF